MFRPRRPHAGALTASTTALIAAILTLACAGAPAESASTPETAPAPTRAATPAPSPAPDATTAESGPAGAQGTTESTPLARRTGSQLGAIDALYAPWARVLENYVDEEGLVDYEALSGPGRADLQAYITAIGDADPDSFAGDEQKMAFWMNAYNAVVVWQVVERYPLDSVRDLDRLFGLVADFFKQEYRVGGAERSLDNIEHDILRAEFADARIHWTLVCGAFGCPRLLRRPYVADDLDPLMTELSFEFLSNPRAVQIDADSSTLYLSSYFDWYGGDFEAETDDVVDWVLQYAPADKASWIRANRDSLRVRFMDYDWTLNDQSKGPRAARPIER